MLRSAMEGQEPILISWPGYCVFCGRSRPLDLLATWMCSQCKRKTLFELFSLITVPAGPAERSESAITGINGRS
jgi:hypothetical protein